MGEICKFSSMDILGIVLLCVIFISWIKSKYEEYKYYKEVEEKQLEEYGKWLIKIIRGTTSTKEEMDQINRYVKLKGGYLTISTLEDIILNKHKL